METHENGKLNMFENQIPSQPQILPRNADGRINFFAPCFQKPKISDVTQKQADAPIQTHTTIAEPSKTVAPVVPVTPVYPKPDEKVSVSAPTPQNPLPSELNKPEISETDKKENLQNLSDNPVKKIVKAEKSATKNKKSKKKKVIIIVAAIVAFLLLVGSGCWYYFTEKAKNQDSEITDFNMTLSELVTKMNEVKGTLPAEYQREEELDVTQFLASTTTKEINAPNGIVSKQYIYEDVNLDGVIIIIRVAMTDGNADVNTAKVTSVVIKFNQSSLSAFITKALGLQAEVAMATDADMTFDKFQSDVESYIKEQIDSDNKSAYLMCGANSYGEKYYDKTVTLHVWAGKSYFAYEGYNEEETLAFNEVEREADTVEIQASNEKYSGSSVEVKNALWSGTFADALATNSDVVGWLGINGTNVTGPVLQSGNNDYYLTRTIYKKYSRFGSRFVDYRCNVNPNNQSQNITIYGHFSDEGIIFAKLHKYKDLAFFKEHSTIEFSTPDQVAHYKVFAVFITNTLSSHGKIFEYRDPEFASQKDFLHFIERVKRRSIISTDVDIAENDKILTLSTCTREFKQARLVVMARKIRDGESYETNTSNYGYNANPLYPNVWYKQVNTKLKKPYYADES